MRARERHRERTDLEKQARDTIPTFPHPSTRACGRKPTGPHSAPLAASLPPLRTAPHNPPPPPSPPPGRRRRRQRPRRQWTQGPWGGPAVRHSGARQEKRQGQGLYEDGWRLRCEVERRAGSHIPGKGGRRK